MSKVLITGAAGFIGKALFQRCMNIPEFTEIATTTRRVTLPWECNKKHKIDFTIDLSVQSEVEKMFAKFKPDIIFHLAANPITKLDDKFPIKIWKDNVLATQNLVNFCPPGCKFVFASSIIVYGDWLMKEPQPLSSTEFIINTRAFMEHREYKEFDECKPTSIYGATKLAAEQIIRIYTEMERIIGCSARLSATIGIGASHGIIPDLIGNCRFGSESHLPIIGDCPGSSKPYVYIDDTVSALIHLVGKNGIYNVSSSDIASCEVIGNEILAKFGHPNKNRIGWRGEAANWKGDNRELRINPEKLLQSGWNRRFSTAQEAIRQVVQDYHENYICEKSNTIC